VIIKFKIFETNLNKELTFYHGTYLSPEQMKYDHILYLTPSLKFCKSFCLDNVYNVENPVDKTIYIYKIKVRPNKILNTTIKKEMKDFILNINDKMFNHQIFDFYDNNFSKWYDDYIGKDDNWYFIEENFVHNEEGLIEFEKFGYDAVIITEYGFKNLMIWKDDIIRDVKLYKTIKNDIHDNI
jgi:hypothetical protein